MSMLDPINPENPCGEEMKYDDAYLAIEIEIEKSFNAIVETDVQWDEIASQCETLLAQNTKDLKIASYWLFATWKMHGWGAFVQALEMYTQLLETFRDKLYPLQPKRKEKILDWIESRLGDPLSQALGAFSNGQLENLSETLERLNNVTREITEGKDTFFKKIQQDILDFFENEKRRIASMEAREKERREEELRRKEEEKRQEESKAIRRVEEEEILSKFSPASSSDVQENPSHHTPLGHENIEALHDPLLGLARSLFEQAPFDYFSFKMLFSLGEILWEDFLRDSEVIYDDFVPSDDVRRAVLALRESAVVTSEQLRALEEQIRIRPTWLEGYFVAAGMLRTLGEVQTAEKLEGLIVHFLFRHTELMDMSVEDTPFLGEKLVAWAKKNILDFQGEGAGSDQAQFRQVYQEALTLYRGESAEEAFAFLEEYYRQSRGAEERFRWRLIYVELALEVGDKRLALALLLELERLIEAHRIDQWQPDLAIATYEQMLKPILIQELGAEAKERIYQKLSILDVQKVIQP